MTIPEYYLSTNGDLLKEFFDEDFEQAEIFCVLNARKYLKRYKNKNGTADLRKEQVYISRLLDEYSARDCKTESIEQVEDGLIFDEV